MIIDNDDLVIRFEFLRYIPGYFGVRDVNLRYCGWSTDFVKVCGWDNVDQAMHKKYCDIPCEMVKAAELFIYADEKVIQLKQDITTINIYKCIYGTLVTLDHKQLLTNNQGESIGIFAHAVDITSIVLKQSQQLSQSDSKFINQIKTPQQYILTPEASPLPLSPRQQECLALLVRGKSMKEIAYILKISGRTVETHFENIKHKLSCYNKSQLIEKAIDSGFLFHIPSNFLGIHLTPNLQLSSISSDKCEL